MGFPEHPVSNRVFAAGAASRRLKLLGIKKNLNDKERRSATSHSAATSEENLHHTASVRIPPRQTFACANICWNKVCSQLKIIMFFPGDYFVTSVCQSTSPAAFYLKSAHITNQTHYCCVFSVVALWLSAQTFHPPVLHETHHFMVLRFCVISFCVYNCQHISCISQLCIWTRLRSKCVTNRNQSHRVLGLL